MKWVPGNCIARLNIIGVTCLWHKKVTNNMIYLFISLSHCTGAGVASVALSSSLPALGVVISTTYGAASDESARGWRPFRFSERPYIIMTMARCVRGGSQWDQLILTVTSLCVSCRSHCYLFACYYYFMLRLFILCYVCLFYVIYVGQ